VQRLNTKENRGELLVIYAEYEKPYCIRTYTDSVHYESHKCPKYSSTLLAISVILGEQIERRM